MSTTINLGTPSSAELPNVTGKTVAVLAGHEIFQVHLSLLLGTSEFFKNALKPEWRKERSNPLDLSGVDSTSFTVYSQWLYSGRLPSYAGDGTHIKLATLYVCGECIRDETFQKAIIESMIAAIRFAPSVTAMRIIHTGTTSSTSPARRLMADACAFSMKPDSDRRTSLDSEVDGEIVLDIIAAMVKYRARPKTERPWNVQPETYHFNHPGNEETDQESATDESMEVTET